MTEMRDFILPEYPAKLVNLKTISGADEIRSEGGKLHIGAMTKLSKIAEADKISMDALKTAAHSVATPLVRNLATIGGNICQDVRCWFYRYPEEGGGALNCARKGGKECHGNACSEKCPAGTDISAYMEKLREGDVQAAADILIEYNPMPAITGCVCAHFCEQDCNRGNKTSNQSMEERDDSVGIHNVERFLGDYIFAHADRYYPAPAKETGKKVALIGAGPAGLAAAYYLRRAGHSVTVFDKMEKPGGMLMYAIPNYRLPKEYVEKLTGFLTGMGVEFRCGVNIGETVEADAIEKEYDKVFYATGAWKRPVLGKEDSGTITEEQALNEAKRCMNCGCYSVNASDMANVLLALDAEIVTTERKLKAEEFFTTEMDTKYVLVPGEIVTEIVIPEKTGYKTVYDKFRLRESVDFAVLALAASWKADNGVIEDLNLVFGAVAPVPVRAYEVEAYLKGKKLTPEVIEAACNLTVKDCIPLWKNGYKIQIMKTLLKRFLETV